MFWSVRFALERLVSSTTVISQMISEEGTSLSNRETKTVRFIDQNDEMHYSKKWLVVAIMWAVFLVLFMTMMLVFITNITWSRTSVQWLKINKHNLILLRHFDSFEKVTFNLTCRKNHCSIEIDDDNHEYKPASSPAHGVLTGPAHHILPNVVCGHVDTLFSWSHVRLDWLIVRLNPWM